jgi:hypothetical protein
MVKQNIRYIADAPGQMCYYIITLNDTLDTKHVRIQCANTVSPVRGPI